MYIHTCVHTGCHKSWKDDASLPLLGSLTSTILSDIFNDIDVYTYRQAIFRVRGGGYDRGYGRRVCIDGPASRDESYIS